MRFPRVLPTLTLTAACAAAGAGMLAAAPGALAASTDLSQASSENWSGYVAGAASGSSRRFRSVTGSWTEPAAKCARSSGRTYSAFWVGLGGSDSSGKLEQAGTEADCTAAGRATYHAWYELVPSAPVRFDLAVHAGDAMTATTTVDGDTVTNTIVDHTTGQAASRTRAMSDPDVSTAEWIAEAPSACRVSTSDCTPLPLTNFGTVHFTGASATDTNGHTGSIGDARWSAVAVTLDPSAGPESGGGANGYAGIGVTTSAASSGDASPASPTAGGSAFTVTYGQESSQADGSGDDGPTPDAGDGYGYGYGYGSGGYGAGYGNGAAGYAYGDGAAGYAYDSGSGGGYGDGGYGATGYGDGYYGY